MSDSKPPTFKLDDDKDALGRLCALSWFDGVRGEYELLVNVGEDDARQLAAKLTAWLDAPRLEARLKPEVVASDDGTRSQLLRTSLGEWGMSFFDGDEVGFDWYAGPDAERNARTDYANARGKALCVTGCEVDEDEIDRSGDEPMCPRCVAEAHENISEKRWCDKCAAPGMTRDYMRDGVLVSRFLCDPCWVDLLALMQIPRPPPSDDDGDW